MMEIRVTNHAAQRFVQRSRLHLVESQIRNPKRAIAEIFNTKQLESRWKQCPFYRNKHGNREFLIWNNMVFVATVEDGYLVVLSFVKNMHGVICDGKRSS